MATAGNDTASVNRYGQTATWDGLGGVDTLYFDSRAWHGIKITLDNAGYIHVDSTTSASGYHITLKNVEHVQYHGVAVDVNGVALTKTGVYYDLTSLFPSAFTTSDTTAPTVTTFSPVDAVTGVAVDANIVVTFSEAVQKGTGLIEIHAGSATGTVVESYEASTSSNLTFSGSTLTINPTTNLANSTQYFVTFAAGSVKDLASNIYAGTTAYDFTTIGDYNTINGTTGNDSTLTTGGAGKDHIFGLAGNDVIDGGANADSLVGGAGNDIYIVDNTGDVVVEALNEGTDLVKSSVNFTLSDNIETLTLTGTDSINGVGNSLKNTMTGNEGNNTLDGGGDVDKLIGGLGDDTYIIDLTTAGALQDTITEVTSAGNDTLELRGSAILTKAVTFTLAAVLENLDASLTGTTNFNFKGNVSANTLTGNDAANILDGAAGIDTLIGGDGNDTYVVDTTDTVIETNAEVAGGIDLVNVSVATADGTFTLGANVENATLINKVAFSLTGNSLDNILTGNAAINTLSGDVGNDTLNGGAGADVLIGGAGNDIYVVDNAADVITELTGEGADNVQSIASYTLGAYLENLTLTGKSAINASGNTQDNVLTGNDGANILDGGAGVDTMIGGLGKDTFVVDSASDVVTETSTLAAEIDTVKSGIDYTLGVNLENLTLTGSAINGTGNMLKNIITGNDSNNVLDGGAGVDKLIGGLGNDTYIIDLTVAGKLEDTITETGGIDTLQLRGTTTNTTAVTLTLAKTLENLNASATVTSLLNLTGNTFDNILTGNAANNVLSGLVGNDTLIGDAGNDKLMGGLGLDNLSGGLGNDTFVFDSALNASTNVDVITDFTSGADKLQLSAKIFAKVKGVKFADVFHDTAITDSHVNNYIIYDSSTGIVSYDADGAGAGAAVQFATLTGLSTLTASDFTVV